MAQKSSNKNEKAYLSINRRIGFHFLRFIQNLNQSTRYYFLLVIRHSPLATLTRLTVAYNPLW